MKKQRLLPLQYADCTVHFQDNGYLNATESAKKYDREVYEFLRTVPAKRKIRQIREKLGFRENQVVIIKQGAPETGGGTWFHPKLAVTFASWLDDEFAWWCGVPSVALCG